MKRSFYFTHLVRERPEVDVVIASLNVRFREVRRSTADIRFD